jgi:branched-chain amino acid transport system substrate-binding protein
MAKGWMLGRRICASVFLLLGVGGAAAGAEQTLSDDAVRIGVLTDQSGVYVDFSGPGSVVAAKMAAEDMGGEVLGVPIEILSADHRNDVARATAVADRWFREEGVDAIADLTNPEVAVAVQQLAAARGKVTLVAGTDAPELQGRHCSRTGFHWTFAAHAQAAAMARALTEKQGADAASGTWFILSADTGFARRMETAIRRAVKAADGQVLGRAIYPRGTPDITQELFTAMNSGADVIALASAGNHTATAITQASLLGIKAEGHPRLAVPLVSIADIKTVGLAQAKGLRFATPFYWKRTEGTRSWARRYHDETGVMPGMVQAGVYSAVHHYLKAIVSAGVDNGSDVAKAMRDMPVQDIFTHNGRVRADGRMVHDLFMVQTKAPAASSGPWDFYRVAHRIRGEDVFRSAVGSACALAN